MNIRHLPTLPYLLTLLIILVGLAGISTGCGNSEGNVKTYHRWFNVSDQQSSMYALNEKGPKAYAYRTVREPTEKEQSQFSVATEDGLPPGIDDPNYQSRVKRGKLSDEQIAKLKGLFSEEKVKKYAEGQTDSTVAECRKKEGRLVITWFIGTEVYSACWEHPDQIEDASTKEMKDYILELKNGLTLPND